MSNTETSESVTANVELSVGDLRLKTRVSVPKGPTRVRELIPLAQAIAGVVVDAAVKDVEADGKTISCKKGCGACCRQLVPITEVEARRIRDLIEEMPEPRRTQIRQRFADARHKLATTPLLEKLLHTDAWTEQDFVSLGIDYFFQGVPCPFLEEESCSIHPDRPITCREYLVTSPAEECARPSRDKVHLVPLKIKVWTALARLDKTAPSAKYIRWVPLILAPEWADAHSEESPSRTGPQLLEELFEHLSGKQVQTQQPVAPPINA